MTLRTRNLATLLGLTLLLATTAANAQRPGPVPELLPQPLLVKGALYITGTHDQDTVFIFDDSEHDRLYVEHNEMTYDFASSFIHTIHVQLHGGSNAFIYRAAGWRQSEKSYWL